MGWIYRPLLQGHRTSCDRNDLIELLPDLDYTTLNILDE
jgi:hypothetical protein